MGARWPHGPRRSGQPISRQLQEERYRLALHQYAGCLYRSLPAIHPVNIFVGGRRSVISSQNLKRYTIGKPSKGDAWADLMGERPRRTYLRPSPTGGKRQLLRSSARKTAASREHRRRTRQADGLFDSNGLFQMIS